MITSASTFACSQIGSTSPYSLAAMLDAFAEREDRRIAGAHLVVADDRPVHGQAGRGGDFGDRPDAGADDHHVGVQRGAVFELEVGDAAVRSARSSW